MARFRSIKGVIPSMYPQYRIKVGCRGEWQTSKDKGKKYQKMIQWGYFKVVTNEKDRTTGNFIPANEINKILGSQPKELNVALAFDNPLLSIFSRYLCWKKDNADEPCFCEGDGQKASRWIEKKGKENIRKMIDCNDVEPCPYFARKECRLDARIVVRLLDITDRPVKALFKTTSANALGDWLECCYDVALASGGILKDIPLKMVIKPYQQAFPDTKNGTVKMGPISYIVGLEQAENNEKVLALANEYRKMRALSGIDQKMLESGQMEFQARLLNAIPDEDGDEPEYYDVEESPAENGEPLISEKYNESWESKKDLIDTINTLAPTYWPDKSKGWINVELGKILPQGTAALINLYEDMIAAREEKSGSELEEDTDQDEIATESESSDPLTADLMIDHIKRECNDFYRLKGYMGKMAKFYNSLPKSERDKVQAAKQEKEQEFASEGQTVPDQESMFNGG